MSLKVSSGLTLSTDYFLRNFYADNRDLVKDSNRKNFSHIELSFEDSRALSRAARRLTKNDYGSDRDADSDIDETTKSSLEAFVKIYNNALDSTDEPDTDTQHCISQLKSLSKKYADELKGIGINVESNGRISINDDLLSMADTSKVRKIFSPEHEFSKKALELSKRLNTAVQNNLYSKVTGEGLHINITM